MQIDCPTLATLTTGSAQSDRSNCTNRDGTTAIAAAAAHGLRQNANGMGALGADIAAVRDGNGIAGTATRTCAAN